ncbi:Os04g0415900, partial [Oryza sativa Japonica Group]
LAVGTNNEVVPDHLPAPGRRRRHRRSVAGCARRGQVRQDAGGEGGAEAGAVREGGAGPRGPAAGRVLRGRARHRHAPEPRVPVRRAAVQHREALRRQAGGGHHHPQALQTRQPPRRLQVRRLHAAQPAGLMTTYDGLV